MQDLNQLQAYLRQFHYSKNVSMAFSVEVSELLENFQWLTEAALNASTEVIKNTYRTVMILCQKGGFSDQQGLENAGNPEESEWVQLPEHINTTQSMFVTRVVGESMKKRVINGSWCLFKANPGGSRNGKIVLVQHCDIEDPDHGGTYTVKTYHSEKQKKRVCWLINASY
jgi:hypothetical protein